MFNKLPVLFLLVLMSVALKSFSQETISIRDYEAIRYRSERLIASDLKGLLNNISTNDQQNEVNDMVKNSYAGTRNRIFLDDKIIVEDDINPSFRNSQNTREVDIDKYLKDFDLMYKKSETPNVIIGDVRVSNLKKKNDYYVLVYFTSFFRNQNKASETAYGINNRVAEMRFKKQENIWQPVVAHIGFFNPADTVSDVLNDVVFQESSAALASLSTDSASAAKAKQSFEEELKEKERKRLIEETQKENQAFNEIMKKGDLALEQNDYIEAIKLYGDAKALRPYDPLPQSSIQNANRKKQAASISADESFTGYIAKARTAVQNREYDKAYEYFTQAIKIKPAELTNFEKEKNDALSKYRSLNELNEKFKAGLYKDAISEYSSNIKKGSKIKNKDKDKIYSDYFLGRGKCYNALNDSKKALADYNDALDIDPSNLAALAKRAELYKKLNDNIKALSDYSNYTIINKDSADIFIEMANLRLAINSKNFDEAIKDIDKGLADNPKSDKLYLKKGLLLVEKNDFKNAFTNFSTVIKIDSNHAFAYYNRGVCELTFNHIQNAALDFESARQKGLDSGSIKKIESYAEVFYDKATKNFSANKKDSAIAYIDFAISINPNSSLYRFTRGEYFYAVANYNEAIKSYDYAVLLNNKYAEAFYKRGMAYYQLRNYQTAIESFDNTLSINIMHYQAQKGRGDAFYALGDYNKASNSYAGSIQTMTSIKNFADAGFMAETYNSLGKSYYNINDYEKAMAALKNSVKKNPNLAEAYFNRGLTYYKTNELSDAIEDITKGISLENKHYDWYYHLAKSYQAKKDYVNAATNYTQCILLDTLSKSKDAIYERGLCKYQMQNYSEALVDYQKYSDLHLDSTVANYDYELGNIYLNLGKYDSAYNSFNKVYTKEPGNGLATYGMASSLYLKGKPDDALAWFEKSFQSKALSSKEIKRDKRIEALQKDKRFKDLLNKYY